MNRGGSCRRGRRRRAARLLNPLGRVRKKGNEGGGGGNDAGSGGCTEEAASRGVGSRSALDGDKVSSLSISIAFGSDGGIESRFCSFSSRDSVATGGCSASAPGDQTMLGGADDGPGVTSPAAADVPTVWDEFRGVKELARPDWKLRSS